MDNSGVGVQGNMPFVDVSLNDIPTLAMQGLLGETTQLSLPSNAALPEAFNSEHYFVIVRSGWVALECDGKAFCIIRPGEVFFQSAWPGDAMYAQRNIVLAAATPVELILVDRASFLAVTEPSLLFSMYALISRRMLLLTKTTAHLARERWRNRLTYFLWELSIPRTDGTRRLPALSPTIVSECLGIPIQDILRQRDALRSSGQLVEHGSEEYFSTEVGTLAMAAGYGLD